MANQPCPGVPQSALLLLLQGIMRVRRLDWVEALQSAPAQPPNLEPGPASAPSAPSSPPSGGPSMAVQLQQTVSEASSLAVPASVPREDQFEVILGTDIMYEVNPPTVCCCLAWFGQHDAEPHHPLSLQAAHPPLVAAVLKQRLQPGGTALIACAVRDQVRLLKEFECLLTRPHPL